MASIVADIFRQAADLNSNDSRRKGNVVYLGEDAQVVVAGDIHGNRKGLAKIIKFAGLGESPKRHLVLQEIIHCPADPATGHDRSVEPLLRAARLKLSRPQQTLFLLGNHDIAQITGNEIITDGESFCKSFRDGVEFSFGDDADQVYEAIEEFFMSLPLAIRCANGVFISHSLPSPDRTELAGIDILDRPFAVEDFKRGQPVYEWVWGRRQTEQQLEELAGKLSIDFFVLGHQHTDEGFRLLGPRGIVVVSDHGRGCAVRFDSTEHISGDNIAEHLHRIAGL